MCNCAFFLDAKIKISDLSMLRQDNKKNFKDEKLSKIQFLWKLGTIKA